MITARLGVCRHTPLQRLRQSEGVCVYRHSGKCVSLQKLLMMTIRISQISTSTGSFRKYLNELTSGVCVQVNNTPMAVLVDPVYDCLFRLAQPDALVNEVEVTYSMFTLSALILLVAFYTNAPPTVCQHFIK